jgi:hypothetical protein
MSSGGEQRGEGELCPRQALDVVSSLHEIVSECLPRSLLARPSLAAGRHGCETNHAFVQQFAMVRGRAIMTPSPLCLFDDRFPMRRGCG